jgi:putative SOS response-associated peptidase YedK
VPRTFRPTERIPIIRLVGGRPVTDLATWWLLSPWAAGKVDWKRTKAEGRKYFVWKPGTKPNQRTHFNSKRATLLAEQGNFYWRLLEGQRCVLPADAFVEWPDEELGPKGPGRLFRLRSGRPFLFAGIWSEEPDDEGHPFLTANLITTDPNALLLSLPHKRMPAMLTTPDEVMGYLQAPSAEAAAAFLQPYPAEDMEMLPWGPEPVQGSLFA